MLTLTLNLAQSQVAGSEPVRLTVALRNTGAEPVTVNKRLALNSPFAPAKFREVKLAIVRENGEALTMQAKVSLGFPQESDFVTIAPDEVVERQFDLRQYYMMAEPGAYTVQALYQNQTDPSTGPAWKGEMESNPVTVRIE